jgi:hypothetical protein
MGEPKIMYKIVPFNLENFPKPTGTNGSNSLTFFHRETGKIWILGEMLETNRHFEDNCGDGAEDEAEYFAYVHNFATWLIYSIENDKFSYEKIPIPTDIKLGLWNSLTYNHHDNLVYILSSDYRNKYRKIGGVLLFCYNLNNNKWDLIHSFEDEFVPERLIYDNEFERIIIFYTNGDKKIGEFYFNDNSFKEHAFVLPHPSERGFSITYDNKRYCYIYGGFDRNDNCYNRMYRMDSHNMRIESEIIVEKLTARTFAFCDYIEKHNAILFYGGTPDGFGFVNDGFIYFIDKEKWLKIIDLPNLAGGPVCVFDPFSHRLFFINQSKFLPDERRYVYIADGIMVFNIDKIISGE